MRLNGRDPAEAIRQPAVSAAASKVASLPAVRALLVECQRHYGQGRDLVSEGRDQGTVVFPQARPKFFLTASDLVRAQRRRAEMLARPGDVPPLEEVLAQLRERDLRDSTRAVGPLRAAADAVRIDTSELTPDDILARMLLEVGGVLRGVPQGVQSAECKMQSED